MRAVYAALRRQEHAFVREQTLLDLDAAGVAAQRGIGTHNPMAGNHDRDRIAPERVADRAHRFRTSNTVRNVAVGGKVAERDFAGCREDRVREGGDAGKVERNLKTVPLPPKILRKLPGNPLDAMPVNSGEKPPTFQLAAKSLLSLLRAKPDLADAAITDSHE